MKRTSGKRRRHRFRADREMVWPGVRRNAKWSITSYSRSNEACTWSWNRPRVRANRRRCCAASWRGNATTPSVVNKSRPRFFIAVGRIRKVSGSFVCIVFHERLASSYFFDFAWHAKWHKWLPLSRKLRIARAWLFWEAVNACASIGKQCNISFASTL